MNKAFLFDMDGVLVDSESAWEIHDKAFLRELLGIANFNKLGSVLGMSRRSMLEKILGLGVQVDEQKFQNAYEQASSNIYAMATITDGTKPLSQLLIANQFKLGLVTSSEQAAIDQVVSRLPFKENLEVIISLNDRIDLKPKPNPDGYLEALRILDADPKRSIVLEDSNYGIQAAKEAGCFVIGYRAHLVPNYEQTGADAYADTMDEVVKLVTEFIQK